ncbi:hypothetical protein CKF54_06840 [Psittacicella hinzii]|uniref:Type I restriction modification DNA specificity domain-containing protein n=1 Tax=Psittacicella hinzii TaxID=2028575 RepID=A0A3A1XZB9_9GAMM|nr:restriction endonuclease subunit S [Psittacicella hinzii]RIY31333.1 hypothetical protein CKF54_06840 [Psittacicella hinzii]
MTLPDYTGLTLKEKEELRQRTELRPPLRFPEFTKPWVTDRVKNVFDTITRGKVLPTNLMKSAPNNEYRYPVYSSQTKNYGVIGYYNQFLFDSIITWTTDGYAGETKFRKGKFYATNICGALISNSGLCNNCIAEAINKVTPLYVTSGVFPKLMNRHMAEVLFSYPEEGEEQKKISKLMQDVDDLIYQTDLFLEKYYLLKRAVIERVYLTSLDAKRPRCRFPGFTEEWKVATLSDLATIVKPARKENIPDRFIYVDLEAVKGTILLKERIEEKATAPSRAKLVPKKGDIFFQLVRPYQKNNYFFEKESDIPYVFSNGYGQIRVNQEHDPYFVFSALQSWDVHKRMIVNTQGGLYPAMKASTLGEIKLGYSPNIEEQKKISHLIKTIDKQIETITTRLANLRKLKKGLVQQMFC